MTANSFISACDSLRSCWKLWYQ